MVICLSCTPESLPTRTPIHTTKFGPNEALVLLNKCTNFNHLKQIHCKMFKNGLAYDQVLMRKAIQISSCYGHVEYASMVFSQIHCPHTFSWNVMIRAYSTTGWYKESLDLFNCMMHREFRPDKFTFPFVVKGCVECRALWKGKEVHGLAMKCGFYGDLFLQNTLMDLYFKCGEVRCGCLVFDRMRVRSVVSWTIMVSGLVSCGELDYAREVFEQMPDKNVVSWSAMIDGYVSDKQPKVGFELFGRMLNDNVRPNEFTLVSLLRGCAELGSLKLGRWVHDFALKNGFKFGVYLGTALIDMYSKCDGLEDARRVFDKMEVRSVATWNTMITSLGVHGFGEEALLLFAKMEKENVPPDAVTFVGVLSACVNTNNVEKGSKYFSHMKECYGIEPVLEHYNCMIELYNRANMSGEPASSVKTIPLKLNDLNSIYPIVDGKSDKAGLSDMRNIYNEHIKELNTHQLHPSSYDPSSSFEWDVG